MSKRPILVGTDFSEEAHLAVSHAAQVARRRSCPMVILHVVPSSSMGKEAVPFYGALPASYLNQLSEIRASAKRELKELCDNVSASGVEVSERVVEGAPAEALIQVAEEIKAQLVVVATRGRGSVSRWLMGSVAEKVVRTCACDVLVARTPGKETDYARILAPTDFSALSEKALERATILAASGANIDMLHAWNLPGVAPSYWGAAGREYQESVTSSASDYAAARIAKHSDFDGSIAFVLEQGEPRKVVEEQSKKHKYDLIVMGTQGRDGINRWVMGSVAESVLRHIDVSVYLVH